MKFWYKIASMGRKFEFPYCKKCGGVPSKIGNYTNMEIIKIKNPWKFDRKYGLMCAEHAGELTESFKNSLNLNCEDIKQFTEKAMLQIMEEISVIKTN